MTLHLGKHPAEAVRAGTPAMRDLLKALPPGALPAIPTHFGHGLAFGYDGWGMKGNGPQDDNSFPFDWAAAQGCGDCAWAGPAHEEMEAARTAGRPVPHFSGATVVAQYSAYSGYDPQSGANDNGSNVQDVLAWRQSKGLLDDNGHAYRIGQHVALAPGNMTELWAATYLFENVGVGVQFQQAQMDQFNAGQPWDYVKGSPVEGGHYVPTMGDNGLVSWGRRVGFTPAWYEHLNDESWAYIDPERYNRVTGRTAEHFADADLERYVVLVAQQKAAAS